MSTPHNPPGILAGTRSPRAVLLDAMGTLVRLRPPVPLLTEALARAGYPNPPEHVADALRGEIAYYRAQHLRGVSPDAMEVLRDECATVLADGLPVAPPHALTRELLVAAIQVEPYADARPLLEFLRARGLRAAVVSNWDCTLAGLLARIGLAPLLDAVVVSAEVGVAKPDPRIFAAALERLGVPAHEALHCGDDPRRDVEGAQGAGVLPVLMDREGRYPDAAPRVVSLAGLRDLL